MFVADCECECDLDRDLDFEGDFEGECERECICVCICVVEPWPEDGTEGVDGAVHPPTDGLVAPVELGYGYDVERLRDV